MAKDQLSDREAALIAQARSELERKRAAAPGAQPAAQPARLEPAPGASAAAAPQAGARAAPVDAPAVARVGAQAVAPVGARPVAPFGATSASGADPAQRIAALLAAARAETERTRERQRKIYVWFPVAVFAAAGMWTLIWMWHRL